MGLITTSGYHMVKYVSFSTLNSCHQHNLEVLLNLLFTLKTVYVFKIKFLLEFFLNTAHVFIREVLHVLKFNVCFVICILTNIFYVRCQDPFISHRQRLNTCRIWPSTFHLHLSLRRPQVPSHPANERI